MVVKPSIKSVSICFGYNSPVNISECTKKYKDFVISMNNEGVNKAQIQTFRMIGDEFSMLNSKKNNFKEKEEISLKNTNKYDRKQDNFIELCFTKDLAIAWQDNDINNINVKDTKNYINSEQKDKIENQEKIVYRNYL
ncbi:2940_t:CDS:2 [Diversispora eburnea]|uniref:2940_t:CDS:1 n=1 Tax=Diversispora eburnea TaxID=1213867 RepID=A0A9N8V555_9GLOM|nr:2940_t:CDS:2 [Diversispora eburnea]